MTTTIETTGRSEKNGAAQAAGGAHVAPVDLRSKVRDLVADLRGLFAERDREVQGMILAALAREHVLLLGPPGTGKSALARAMASALSGSTYFEWLLSRFSTPEELFGPVSLSGMKNDTFVRVTTGKIPVAHVAFLDECFKANSAILNSLLAVLNERVYHNGASPVVCPLISCVGASNELPESAELGALWDRFLVRYWVQPVRAQDAFKRVMKTRSLQPSVSLTIAEWHAAQAEVDAVLVPDATLDTLFALRGKLSQDGIEVSERRWVKLLQLMRAAAWLDGCASVEPDHFVEIAAGLWMLPDQLPKVVGHVQQYASAELASAGKLYDGIIDLMAKLPSPEDPAFEARVIPATRELKKATEKLRELAGKASSKGAKQKIEGMVVDLATRGKGLVEAATKALIQ